MSKYLTFSLILIAFCVGALAGFSLSGTSGTTNSERMMESTHTMSLDEPYSDADFLSEMIVHHEDALKMSEHILRTTKNENIQKMANDIIRTQTQEITTMKEWGKQL